jgi:hypothetical protein
MYRQVAMGKYSPLGEYLRAQGRDEVSMTFSQIEKIIGHKLPHSHRYRAWWSNNDFNSVMTKVWRQAGYESEKVDMKGRKLVFRRVKHASSGHSEDQLRTAKRHPLIGWMKGTVTIAPGVDLAKPAMPEWGEVAYGDKTWDDFK